MGKLRHSGKLARDLIEFASENKVYWIVPLVGVLALVGLLIMASQTTAPFIYTLF